MRRWKRNVKPEPGLRLSLLWPVLAVTVVISLLALAATALRGNVDVVVARHAIPPFTEITAADLEASSVRGESFEGSETSVADLAGKLTTSAVAAGDRLEAADVIALPGDPIPRFRFQIHPDRAEALELKPGEEVRLWFSPAEEGGRTARICARLLAVPDADSVGEQTYVVAVGARQAQVLAARLGSSRLLLSRPG